MYFTYKVFVTCPYYFLKFYAFIPHLVYKSEKDMDAKITKIRLSRMLSYDWLKIVLGAAAAILVWSLIFTMTATRITPAQQFTAFNYLGNATFYSTKFNDLYQTAFNENIFSYEVIEINQNDVAANSDYAADLMGARLATDEGDVIFAADIDKEDTAIKNENGEIIGYEYTYLETLVRDYSTYLYELDPAKENSFFNKMEVYLDGFYDGGWENADTLNEEKVKTQFRNRVKKDKRYKKEAQLLQGEQDDVARIKKYRDALEKFYAWEDAGVVSFTTTVFSDRTDADKVYYPADGVYSVNICPDERTEGLKEYLGYYLEVVDENGQKHYPISAQNMNVAFFRLPGVADGFQYESLLFVNFIIENALAQTQATTQN